MHLGRAVRSFDVPTCEHPRAGRIGSGAQGRGRGAARIDNRLDADARAHGVGHRAPAIVAGGQHDHPRPGRHRETVEVATHRRGQHHARKVVPGKHQRPFRGAGGQHGAAGDDVPEALPRLAGRRMQMMVGDAFQRAVGAVIVNGRTPSCGAGRGVRAGTRNSSWASAGQAAPGSPSISSRSDSSRPPGQESSSHSTTRAPLRPAASVAARPAGPAPITSTSQNRWACS